MGNYDQPELTAPPPHRSRRMLGAGVAVVALVLGLVVGYLLGTAGTAGAPDAADAAPPPIPTSTPAPPPLSPPCLAAGQAGAAILEEVERGVQAIGNLDPTALREVLDRLQPRQAELEQALAGCSGRVGSAGTPQVPPT